MYLLHSFHNVMTNYHAILHVSRLGFEFRPTELIQVLIRHVSSNLKLKRIKKHILVYYLNTVKRSSYLKDDI